MKIKLTSLVEELKSSRCYIPKNNEIGIDIIPNHMTQIQYTLLTTSEGTEIQVTNLQIRLAYWIGCLKHPRQWLCPKITAMFTVIYHHQKYSDMDLWSLKTKC